MIEAFIGGPELFVCRFRFFTCRPELALHHFKLLRQAFGGAAAAVFCGQGGRLMLAFYKQDQGAGRVVRLRTCHRPDLHINPARIAVETDHYGLAETGFVAFERAMQRAAQLESQLRPCQVCDIQRQCSARR